MTLWFLWFSLTLDALRVMPYSTLFVAAVALALNVVANAVTRATMDIDMYRRVQKEYSEYQKQLRAALRTGDPDKADKVRKRYKPVEEQMLKLQMDRMKISFYYLIPFIVLYYLLAWFMGQVPVAVSPYHFNLLIVSATTPLGPGYAMNMVTWYIFTSVAFSVIVTRLFGLQV
ncbi:MAG: EMC3/TMCO1 family protein [Conexivisphaerales archaeon]|nr:EMC3/TMCO1 family protein [Conexivisphaerales archaeon]